MRKLITTACLVLFVFCGCEESSSLPALADAAEDLAASDTAVPGFDVADAPVDEGPASPDVPCPAGQTRCGDACINLQTDATHCGSCDNNCRGISGVNALAISCVQGVCAVHSNCADGFADCDTLSENGCEADLTRPTSCGACGITCSGATPVCGRVIGDGGAATRVCTSGCTPVAPIRCGESCVDTQTNFLNCGACAHRCTPPHAIPSCVGGSCSIATCDTSYANCDHDAANGCETLVSTVENCGACGAACPMPRGPHAGARCIFSGAALACDIVCDSGYVDCDSNLMNGCEATAGNCLREEGECLAQCGGVG